MASLALNMVFLLHAWAALTLPANTSHLDTPSRLSREDCVSKVKSRTHRHRHWLSSSSRSGSSSLAIGTGITLSEPV